MKLRSSLLALILLLGAAYAKDKRRLDEFPLDVQVVGTQDNPYAAQQLQNRNYQAAWDCGMTLFDGHRYFTVASNGFCRSFEVGAHLHARYYHSKLGIDMMELGWYKGNGDMKTAKYRVYYVQLAPER